MRVLTIALAALLGLALVSCGGGATQAPAGSTVKLTLSEFKYSTPTVEILADQKITLELKNAGTVEHDFTIDAIGLKVLAGPAKTVTRTVGPLKAGTYDVYCSIAGHKEAGMVGKLVVK